MMIPHQVVLLADGAANELHPLTDDGLPLPLLPICNRPLLSYPLKMLERSGVKSALVVCKGEAAAAQMATWLSSSYDGPVQCQVVPTREDAGSAEALRCVIDKVVGDTLVVLQADLVSSLTLTEVIATHWVRRAVATVVVCPRKASAASETKPGRAPRGVDYIGLDSAGEHLLFYCPSSPEPRRDVRLPLSLLTAATRMRLTTTLQDCRLYVFQRQPLAQALACHPEWHSLQEQLLPYLLAHQVQKPPPEKKDSLPARCNSGPLLTLPIDAPSCTSHHFATMLNHAPPRGLGAAAGVGGVDGWVVAVYCPPEGVYCSRVTSLQAYGETNREAAAPDVAQELGLADVGEGSGGSPLHPSVHLGAKTQVASGCLVGRGSAFGDKCSAKRTLIGANCQIGNNVKVINSVFMDNVVVDDGCHIQNCVVCSGVHLQQRCNLKDCQIGAGYVVAEGSDLKGEILARNPRKAAGI